MQNNKSKVVFKDYSPNQILLLPPSLEEMIDPNHPVRVVNQVIDSLDIDILIKKFKGGGFSSYHPRLLLKLLVYGYLSNQYSSRKIEQATKQNIHFMWLSAMSYPDHNTINRFRSDRLNGVLKEIFSQVVLLLVEQGIITLKEAYLDGTKIEANANRYTFIWGRSISKSKQRIKKQLDELWSYAESVAREELENNEPDYFERIDQESAIISETTFHRANNVLSGRRRNMKFHDDKSDLYPLKGFLKCPEHNKSLTTYACRSHTGKLHHYYLCCKDKCKHRYRIQDVHESVEDILFNISCSAQIVNLYRKTLEKLFEKDDYQRRDEIQGTKKELEKLELRYKSLRNAFLDKQVTPFDYQEMKSMIDKDIIITKDKLTDLQQQTSPFKVYLQKEVPMLENLLEYYRKADGKTKKKILNTFFAEKLILEKGKVSDPVFTEPIQLILRISEVLRRSEKTKEVDLNQSLVATLTKTRFSEFKSCNPLPENFSTSHPFN